MNFLNSAAGGTHLSIASTICLIAPSFAAPVNPFPLVLLLPGPLLWPIFFLFSLLLGPPPPLEVELFVFWLRPPFLELLMTPIGVGVGVVIVWKKSLS